MLGLCLNFLVPPHLLYERKQRLREVFSSFNSSAWDDSVVSLGTTGLYLRVSLVSLLHGMKRKTTRKKIGMARPEPWKKENIKQPSILSQKTRTWKAISRYIRSKEPSCITCNRPTTETGHFIHNGDKPNKNLGGNALWYNTKNLHGQCAYCNRHRMGNTALYALKLIERYGNGIIEELHVLHQTPYKWHLNELQVIEAYFNEAYEQLQA